MPEQLGLWQQLDPSAPASAHPDTPPSPAQPDPQESVAPAASVALPSFRPPARESSQPRESVASSEHSPERLLILDTETTSLSPDDGQCIEVGAVLFHVPTRAVLTQISFLLPCRVNGAEHVNGIPAAVTRLEQPWQEALCCFEAMAASADAVVAHNAPFDRQWFGRAPLPELAKPWICSMEDMRWPADRHLRSHPSVRDLALAFGVPVWAAHRALTDCIYLAQVFERCDDLEPLLRGALEPRQLYRARVSYAERHRAREAGFRWNDPVPGAWTRRLSLREAKDIPFPLDPVAQEAVVRERQTA